MNSEVERFLGIVRLRVSATTYTRKYYQLTAFINHLLKHKLDYQTINQNDIENYLFSLNCAVSGRQQVCQVIREFYDYLKTPQNPAKKITFLPDKHDHLPQVPSQPVVEGIIRKLSADTAVLSTRNRLMIELAYGSGLRRGELAKLDIEDIDVGAKTAHIQGKGDKQRIVPLTREALDAYQEYLSQRCGFKGPLLVSLSGRRLSVNGIHWNIKKTGIRPHQFRHACASHMLKNGCSTRVIQELLGHKRLTTTQVYTHIIKEDLRTVLVKCHPRNKP
jgi:site-specific recombinase XerD